MKQRDKLIVGLLLLLAFSGRRAKATLPSGGTIDIDPSAGDERMLQPGVYWYCCSAGEAPELVRWMNDRTLLIAQTKLLGSNGVDCAIVLFELNGAAYWTLTGLPTPAPAGMATTLQQLGREPSLADFFIRKAQQGLEAVRRMDQKIQQWLDGVFR